MSAFALLDAIGWRGWTIQYIDFNLLLLHPWAVAQRADEAFEQRFQPSSAPASKAPASPHCAVKLEHEALVAPLNFALDVALLMNSRQCGHHFIGRTYATLLAQRLRSRFHPFGTYCLLQFE